MAGEGLKEVNAIALTIFKTYSLENAIFITYFVNAIECCLTVLISKQALIDVNEASCKREHIEDTDTAARLALLEDLLLTLQ